jgi:hypothetical protein
MRRLSIQARLPVTDAARPEADLLIGPRHMDHSAGELYGSRPSFCACIRDARIAPLQKPAVQRAISIIGSQSISLAFRFMAVAHPSRDRSSFEQQEDV